MANNEHINKVVKSTGETLIDLTNDTVTAGTLLKDVTAHDRSGAQIEGAVIVAPTDVTQTEDNETYLYKSSEHDAVYDELVGGSVAWNQLVQNGNFESTSGWSGVKATISAANNTLTLVADGSQPYTGIQRAIAQILANHVILASYDYDASSISNFTRTLIQLRTGSAYTVYGSKTESRGTNSFLFKHTSTPDAIQIIFNKNTNFTSTDTITVKNFYCVDLTQMFGTTIADYVYNLEQSTAGSGIAWLKSYGFFTKDYYAYNAGALTSVNVSGKKVVGKNLLDASQIVVGSIGGQGQDISSNTRLRTAYISVLPNTTYTAISGNNVQVYEYHEYRTDKSHIKFVSINATSGSNTMSPDTHFIRLLFRYSDNRIMEVSDMPNPQLELGSTATNYEPYTSITYPIQSTDLRGLYKLNGTKLYTDGDIYSADGTVTRKYGYRGYQSGDESLANAITDGAHTIYKLSAPTTETASSYISPQMVYRNGTEEYLDTRDVPIPVGGNRKYVDIPDWMVNEYFDDLRAETSTISDIIKDYMPLSGGTMTGDINFNVTSSEKKLKTTSGNVEIEFDGSALHLSAADVSGQAAQHLADILLMYDNEADTAALLMGADNVFIGSANWETLISLDGNGISLTLPTNYATPSNLYIDNMNSGSGSEIVIGANGDVYRSSSSRDIKHNIQYIEDTESYHDALMRIKPATYVYNNDKTEIAKLGMIAEDIADVMPIAALTGEGGKVENYDTRAIIAMLVMEVQRLNADIRRLRGDSNAD